MTTTFAENPQVPFSSFKLQFTGEKNAVLTSAPSCGPEHLELADHPVHGNGGRETDAGLHAQKALRAVALARKPRPNAPSGRASRPARNRSRPEAFSPFSFHIGRSDGEQEIKGVEVSLPPGLTGKLKGVPYCSGKDLAKAAGQSGEAERKSASCPDNSQIRDRRDQDGQRPVADPDQCHGLPRRPVQERAALDGACRAESRRPLRPRRRRGQGAAPGRPRNGPHPSTSDEDAIPDVFGGAKLDIRSINVNVNKNEFIINPTSCGPLSASGNRLLGGGSRTRPIPRPSSSFAVSSPFQTSGCRKLGFRPKFSARLFGGRKIMFRNHDPKFRAVVVARHGDSNLQRAAVTLPRATILDQRHIGTLAARGRSWPPSSARKTRSTASPGQCSRRCSAKN